MQQRIIVLRGGPASGKTTIAKSYRNYEEKMVWLKVDNFKVFFSDDSSPSLKYVNGSAIATLDYLLDQGFSVIIDGIFQDTAAIDDALRIAKDKKIPIKVFELQTSLDTLKKRDLIRDGVPQDFRKPLGNKVIEEIYNNLKNNPYEGALKLDTENNNVEECKKIIDSSFI
jgi:predicted kinase